MNQLFTSVCWLVDIKTPFWVRLLCRAVSATLLAMWRLVCLRKTLSLWLEFDQLQLWWREKRRRKKASVVSSLITDLLLSNMSITRVSVQNNCCSRWHGSLHAGRPSSWRSWQMFGWRDAGIHGPSCLQAKLGPPPVSPLGVVPEIRHIKNDCQEKIWRLFMRTNKMTIKLQKLGWRRESYRGH